jgi:hypothetical protein
LLVLCISIAQGTLIDEAAQPMRLRLLREGNLDPHQAAYREFRAGLVTKAVFAAGTIPHSPNYDLVSFVASE